MKQQRKLKGESVIQERLCPGNQVKEVVVRIGSITVSNVAGSSNKIRTENQPLDLSTVRSSVTALTNLVKWLGVKFLLEWILKRREENKFKII